MGQSFFSSSVEISGNMRPFVALTFVMGCAYGAPADLAVAGTYAGLGLAGVHGLGYAAAAPVAGVAGVAPVAAAAAPIAYGAEHYSAGPVVPHAPVAYAEPAAPAPYTTATQGAGVTTVHQPAPVVTKQVHLGQTSYVSGYATKIHKPALVNKPYDAPYDAPFLTQKVVEVPTPVHVDAPYNVAVPVPVQGETIVKKTVAPAVVTHSHHVNAAAPVAVAGYAAAPAVAGYAAAPAIAAIH